MFDRFTERARKVMTLARQEAQKLNNDYIGTEHLLLGLLREGSGVAAQVLRSLGVDVQKVHAEVERLVEQGTAPVDGSRLPFTPRMKRVLEWALDYSLELSHGHIGTEHLLLGLIRENDGPAAHVLQKLSVSVESVREEVVKLLSADPRAASPSGGGAEVAAMSPEELSGPVAHLQDALRELLMASPPAGLRPEEVDFEIQVLDNHKGTGFQVWLGRLQEDGSLGTEMSLWVQKVSHVVDAFPSIVAVFACLVESDDKGAAGDSIKK
jgi:ATP-dependent Clp protease ATP-binding subunit ClpA